MPLTGGELLLVATAASVATITNAMAVIKKITSIIPVFSGIKAAASVALLTLVT